MRFDLSPYSQINNIEPTELRYLISAERLEQIARHCEVMWRDIEAAYPEPGYSMVINDAASASLLTKIFNELIRIHSSHKSVLTVPLEPVDINPRTISTLFGRRVIAAQKDEFFENYDAGQMQDLLSDYDDPFSELYSFYANYVNKRFSISNQLNEGLLNKSDSSILVVTEATTGGSFSTIMHLLRLFGFGGQIDLAMLNTNEHGLPETAVRQMEGFPQFRVFGSLVNLNLLYKIQDNRRISGYEYESLHGKKVYDSDALKHKGHLAYRKHARIAAQSIYSSLHPAYRLKQLFKGAGY